MFRLKYWNVLDTMFTPIMWCCCNACFYHCLPVFDFRLRLFVAVDQPGRPVCTTVWGRDHATELGATDR